MSDSSNLHGRLELAIVDSIDTSTMRGTVKSIETNGIQNCIFTMSPYGGHAPGKGALIAVYRKRGYYSRYLFTLSDLVDEATLSIDDRVSNGEEPLGVAPDVTTGDTFLGRYGRILSDDQGNITMYTKSMGQQLTLSDTNNNANLTTWNYKLETPGGGISIATSSSVPSTFGDSITISKNVPLPTIPEELLSTPSVLTNISSIGIDALGGITLSSLAGAAKLQLSAPLAPLGPDVPGRIVLGNLASSLTMETSGATSLLAKTGNVVLTATIGSILLNSIGKTVDITAPACNINAITTKISGSIVFSSPTGAASTSTGPFNMVTPAFTVTSANTVFTGNTSISGNANITGNLKVVGLANFAGALGFVGVPSSLPLVSAVAVALIPVTVNGVMVGRIPVIS